MRDIFPLGMYFVAPLALLIVLRYETKFPASMALLLFFFGPFAGAWALVTVAEMTKPAPMPANIPGAAIFFYVCYGLPIFGLWVTDLGIIAWSCVRRIQSVKQMSLSARVSAGAGLGLLIGPALVFALWAVFSSFDPNWPKPDKISGVIHDWISLFSLVTQGAFAGAICGSTIGGFLDRDTESHGRTRGSNPPLSPKGTGIAVPPTGSTAEPTPD
jgi:hypothetical protein